MIHLNPVAKKRQLIISNGQKLNFIIGSIGINSYINSMNLQLHPEDEVINLQIGNYCSIAYDVTVLINRNHDYKSISTSTISPLNFENKKIQQKGQILIGNDVWIGNNTILLSGINIGNGAVIGAGSVVSKDIPEYSIAVGNPIRIIKYRFKTEQIRKLLSIKWWNWSIQNIEKNKDWFSKNVDEFINNFYKTEKEPKDIFMKTKNKTILFIPDFYDEFSIWKKVINEFINKFDSNDPITLIIRIPQSNEFSTNIYKISQLLQDKNQLPDILVVNDIIDDERSLFKNIDYFVTTRSIDTIRYVEIAHSMGIKVLSGVDIPVFNRSLALKFQ